MKNVPEIKEIDTAMLTEPVRQALDSRTAEIQHWGHRPIRYINTEASNIGIYRFEGTAQDRGEERPWSIVLKAVDAPFNDTDSTSWNYHRREILAYDEGLLANLPGGLSAPRCLGVTRYTTGVCWLWLEDIRSPASQSWSRTEYGLVARHLGQFNGAYLMGYPLPDVPWLSQNWLRGWLGYYESSNRKVLELICAEHFWEQPLLARAFQPTTTDEVLRLWRSHETLFAVLKRLPQTFCHLDAYRPNLFIRRSARGLDQTVAVDWVFTGVAAVGEEIANLLAASLIWFEYDAAGARDLDQAVFHGYLNGLRDAGWQEDERLARLGYAAACALRWGVVGLWWLHSLGDTDREAELENHWNHPFDELVRQWGATTTCILSLAQEAYTLSEEFF